ncbi:MAG TPA: dihydroorotate dehydrogenase [Gemmatimonadaceae bacterium]|nr:dihydroorotate dehydrogenase [Gemmatimonadaceae bacterium]
MTVNLAVDAAGLRFQNPVVLASGTAGYGRELAGVMDLERLGGLVTKAVSVEPRHGNPAPRVAEFPGGMLNAIGLANPGLDSVRADALPWLAAHVCSARVLVNVVGNTQDDFVSVVSGLESSPGFHGFELNVSCPNVHCGGLEFGADRTILSQLVSAVREKTKKVVFVKLSPTLPAIADTARAAADAGADGITVINTVPGLVIDTESRKAALGFGTGGVSGPAILPIGVLATYRVAKAVQVPIIGLGGVARPDDVVQYLLAGASLVGVGTAALKNPRVPERLVRGLAKWCERHGVGSLTEIIGSVRL